LVNICGIVTDIRYLIDKKNNKMAFIKIEDFNNTYEAVVFGSVFPNVKDKLKIDALLLLRGRLNSEADDPVIKIICEEVYDLETVPSALTAAIYLRIDKSELSEENITYIKNTLHAYPGKLPIYFHVAVNGKDDLFMVSKKLRVSVNAPLLIELEKILHLENIKVKVK
jgi:DNA polymerase-3 subunit alpha